MKLKCNECGSENTVFMLKHALDKSVGTPLEAVSGCIPPQMILEILSTIAAITSALMAYLQYRVTRKGIFVCVCRDCGHWERL